MESGSDPCPHMVSVPQGARRRGFGCATGPAESFTLALQAAVGTSTPNIDRRARPSKLVEKWKETHTAAVSGVTAPGSEVEHTRPHRLEGVGRGTEYFPMRPVQRDFKTDNVPYSSNALSRSLEREVDRTDGVGTPIDPPELISPSCDPHWVKLLRATSKQDFGGADNERKVVAPTSSSAAKAVLRGDKVTSAPGHQKIVGSRFKGAERRQVRPPPIVCLSPNTRRSELGLAFNSPASLGSGISSSYESSSGSELGASPVASSTTSSDLSGSQAITLPTISSVGSSEYCLSGTMSSATSFSDGSNSHRDRQEFPAAGALAGNNRRHRVTNAAPVARARGFERPLPRPAVFSSPVGEGREVFAVNVGAAKETRGPIPSSLPRPESIPSNDNALKEHGIRGTSTREGWRQRRQRGRSPPRTGVSHIAGSRLADFGRFIASAGSTVSLRGTSRPLSPITVSRAVGGNLRANQSTMRSPGSPLFDPTEKQEDCSKLTAPTPTRGPTDASRSSYLMGLHTQLEDPRIVLRNKEGQHCLPSYVTPEAGCISATGEAPAPCSDRSSPPAGTAGASGPCPAAFPSPIGIERAWEKSPSWQFLAGRPEPAASPMSMSESCHSQSETDSLLEVPSCIPHVALRPHDADLSVCNPQHEDAALRNFEEVDIRDGGHVRSDRCSVRTEQEEKIADLVENGAGARTGMDGIEEDEFAASDASDEEVSLWSSGDVDGESQRPSDHGRRSNAHRTRRRHRCKSRVSVGSSVSCSLLSEISSAPTLVQDNVSSIADETVGTDSDVPGNSNDFEGSSDRPASDGGFFKDHPTGFPRRSRKGSYRKRSTSVERGVGNIQHISGDLRAGSSRGGRQGGDAFEAKVSIHMDVESLAGVEGSDDSDAESEYTPEEALEVLRKAAIRFSVASSHRDTAAATVTNCSDEGALAQFDDAVKTCTSAVRDDRCTSQWSSLSGDSALDLLKLAREGGATGGPMAHDGATLDVVSVEHDEQDGEKRTSAVSGASEDLNHDDLHLSGEDEENLMEDPEVVLRMEKTFKKACRVLGIEMNRFFDTILESSVGDIDDISATDAAAAVAAAAAGIRTPDDNVVVAPLVTPRVQQSTTQSTTHSESKTGGVGKGSAGEEDHVCERSATRPEPRTSPNTPSPTPSASPKVADTPGAAASEDACAVRESNDAGDRGIDAGAKRQQQLDSAASDTRANAPNVVCVPSACVEPRLLRFATCKRKVVVESGEVARGAEAKTDLLLVKGDFEGTVEVRDLSVESGGILRGDIVAENVMVYGTIDGNLECKNMLVVRRGAKCSGKVFYHDMRVESGADVDADLHLLSRASIDSSEVPGYIPPPSVPPSFAEKLKNNGQGESKGVSSADEGAGAVGTVAVIVPPTVRSPSPMELVLEGTSETSSIGDDTLRPPMTHVKGNGTEGAVAVAEAGSDPVVHEKGSVAERGRCQRRAWVSKPASSSSTAVPVGLTLPSGTPAPSRLLRKHTMHSPERSQSPDGKAREGKSGECVDAVESSTGLSAAVAAMEETQRVVEAARNADEEAEKTNAQLVKEYHASVLSSSVDVHAGGDSWTIRTREITAVVPASPPPSNWMEPGISESTARGNRAKPNNRVTKGTSNSIWSRRFTATETAMVVQEGKRALGAVRKDKNRERSKKSAPLLSPDAPLFPGQTGERPRGRAKARQAAPLISPNAPPFPGRSEVESNVSVGAGVMPLPMMIPLKSPEGMAPAPPVSASTSARSQSIRFSRSASLSPECSTSQSSLVTPTRPKRTSQKQQPGSHADNLPPPKTHDGVPRSRRRRTEQGPPVVTPARIQLRKPRQWQRQRQQQQQIQQQQQDQHEKQQPSTQGTPPSRLGDRCSAFLVHLVRSSSPAKPVIEGKSSPESPGKRGRHGPAPNASSGTPECTPPGDENGSRRDVTDGNKAEASGSVGRGSKPVSQPPSGPATRGRRQKDHVEASPAGVPLVRQSRFRRSVSMEEPSRLRSSRAQTPLREGGASKETLSGESQAPFTQRGGLGAAGEALASRRRLRGWGRISSGVEIGSFWR